MYCVVRFAQAVVISSAHAGLKKTVLRVLSAQVLFISSARDMSVTTGINSLL
jgi:hypothetical protein